ncbi:MAG TPA: ABC transporter substrate-binding protein [Anaerolineales bacterium]|jgi:peptide/nickel transport system substrate-binding protein|nr:ABC transporter substrate-binding protein [Anaerolineales bacterium]
MKMKNMYYVLSFLVMISMVLAACAPQVAATTEAPAETEAPVATEAPATEAPTTEPTAEPTAEPTTRHGGWLDEIDISVVDGDSAISQIQAGAIDFYSFNLASNVLPAIQDAGLPATQSLGGYYGVSLNPAVFTDTTRLNPFSNRKIREALNWLIDRNYINQEIYAGGSMPRLLPITTQLVEYTNLIETARALEAKYAYNPDKAKEVIDAEMPGMGAELTDDKWTFNGEPITLIFLIRSDGDGTRQPMGDYISNQLESVGFTVDRQYKTSSEAFPIWQGTTASDGQWHMYTAGYIPSGLSSLRDERANIQQSYLNTSVQASEPFISNVSDPELQQLGDDLANGNFSTREERNEMMKRALELSLEDSLFVWTIDQQQYAPHAENVQVTYDLATGPESTNVGPYNLRFTDQEGGTMRIGTNDLFTQPWNTVAGSNWVWDAHVMRMTTMGTSNFVGGAGLMADPYTGLAYPQRIETAELTYKEGLPIVQNLDWLTVTSAPQIDVPEDAWADWDATEQQFITAGERFPDGATANIMSRVTYPADLFETVKWHDGSPISVADFVMAIIQSLDPAKPESPIYDESLALSIDAGLEALKGIRITSTDPLTIEYYTDSYNTDAELNILPLWPDSPYGLSGENSWEIFTISNLAEANGELAYTQDKADNLEIENTSWVGGPSLEILAKYLDQAASESYIPYEPTMGQYITKEEADQRYANLKQWYEDHGHFWVGTGPYYLDQVFTTEKSAVLKNNTEFVDLADRWARFSEPQIATTILDGPGQVKVGEEVVFDALVNFKDQPYPQADISQVKYILYDATGSVVSVGDATPVADGQYQVTLPADVTSELPTGSARLEVAVAPIPVAIPSFTSFDFVAVP